MVDKMKKVEEQLKASGINIELTDDLMENATGGISGNNTEPRFKIGDLVYISDGNGSPVTTEILGKIIKVNQGDLGWEYDVEFIKHPTDPGLINEGLYEYLLLPA